MNSCTRLLAALPKNTQTKMQERVLACKKNRRSKPSLLLTVCGVGQTLESLHLCVDVLQDGSSLLPAPARHKLLADPQSKIPGLHRPPSRGAGPEFSLVAHVQVNSSTAPRRHGRIPHPPEDVPYGGFGPDLPCYPPLSHGSEEGSEVTTGGCHLVLLRPVPWSCHRVGSTTLLSKACRNHRVAPMWHSTERGSIIQDAAQQDRGFGCIGRGLAVNLTRVNGFSWPSSRQVWYDPRIHHDEFPVVGFRIHQHESPALWTIGLDSETSRHWP